MQRSKDNARRKDLEYKVKRRARENPLESKVKRRSLAYKVKKGPGTMRWSAE